jgi:hypothetical protein
MSLASLISADFAWDECRRIFAPSDGTFSLRFLSGKSSIDADYLANLTFTDCKIIMEEYLYQVSMKHCDKVHRLTDPAFLMSIIGRASAMTSEEAFCQLLANVGPSFSNC